MSLTRLSKAVQSIKDNRLLVLMFARSNVIDQSNNYLDNISSLLDILSSDSNSYKTIKHSKDMIEQLASSIKNAVKVEDIIKSRNRINYYIGKIKKVISSKEFNEELKLKYSNSATSFKKSIADYLRVIKRQKNIDELDELLLIQDISDEELSNLRKKVTNERKFNYRWLQKFSPKKKEEVKSTKQKVTAVDEVKRLSASDLRVLFDKLAILKEKINNYRGNNPALKNASMGLLPYVIALSVLASSAASFSDNAVAMDSDYIGNQIEYETDLDEIEEVKEIQVRDILPEKTEIETKKAIKILEEDTYDEDEMSYKVRERELLTKKQLNNLIYYLCSDNVFNIKFNNSFDALKYLFLNKNRTYAEKMMVIMAREGLSYKQLDEICSGAVAEGGNYYDETYRVASVLFNRNRSISMIETYGKGLYTQFIAPHQFSVYSDGRYNNYLGRIDLDGYRGAIDMLYSRKPSINYLAFRGENVEIPWTTYDKYLENGNTFGKVLKESDTIEDDFIYVMQEELNEEFGLYLRLSNK